MIYDSYNLKICVLVNPSVGHHASTFPRKKVVNSFEDLNHHFKFIFKKNYPVFQNFPIRTRLVLKKGLEGL